jgi:hypothetical protein
LEDAVSEQTVRSILRLAAVLLLVFATVTMVPGLITSMNPVVDLQGAGVRAAMTQTLLWSYLVMVGSALLLYALSPTLARLITR